VRGSHPFVLSNRDGAEEGVREHLLKHSGHDVELETVARRVRRRYSIVLISAGVPPLQCLHHEQHRQCKYDSIHRTYVKDEYLPQVKLTPYTLESKLWRERGGHEHCVTTWCPPRRSLLLVCY
jgi:hypothetical protein